MYEHVVLTIIIMTWAHTFVYAARALYVRIPAYIHVRVHDFFYLCAQVAITIAYRYDKHTYINLNLYYIVNLIQFSWKFFNVSP